MYNRKLYGTAAATANGVASIIIPRRSRLVGIQWGCRFDNITDNASCVLELSLASATEIAVNNAQQCISECHFWSNFVTSGATNAGTNLFVPVDTSLEQGQNVYLHAVVSGTLTFYANAILWLK